MTNHISYNQSASTGISVKTEIANLMSQHISHVYCLSSSLINSEFKCLIDDILPAQTEQRNKYVSAVPYNINESVKLNSGSKNINQIKNSAMLNTIKRCRQQHYSNYIMILSDEVTFDYDVLLKTLRSLSDDTMDAIDVIVLNDNDANADCFILSQTAIEFIASLDSKTTDINALIASKFNVVRTESCKHWIDFLIPFVNSDDPEWMRIYEHYKGEAHGTYNNKNRWTCNKEYFIENIELTMKNLPWIHKIYILLSDMSQVKGIADSIDKHSADYGIPVEYVEHKKFIPLSQLPTFNSCTIEMYIHCVPGLSEHFIYSNDDVYIQKPLSVSDFYRDGKIGMLIGNNELKTNHGNICRNNVWMFTKEFKSGLPQILLKHTPHPYHKSVCKYIFAKHQSDIEGGCSRFRTHINHNQYIWGIYEYFMGNTFAFEPSYKFVDNGMLENYKDIAIVCINKIFNKQNVALCAIAKNENLYIREWVEWYKNIGVDKIFMYDNNDIDGEHFEDVIGDYINEGLVDIIDFRGKVSTQESDADGKTTQGLAYSHCYDNYYKEYDWIMMFDIDEYLDLENGYDLYGFLADSRFDNYDGIRVQWTMYGDNNMLFYTDKSLFDRFYNDANKSKSSLTKSIMRGKQFHKDGVLFCAHGPLKISGRYKQVDMCNADGTRASNPYRNLFELGRQNAHLAHFYSKSTEEFLSRKWKKTSAVTGVNMKRNYDMNFLKDQYFKYNKRTVEKEHMFDELVSPTPKANKINNNDKIIVNFTTWRQRDNVAPILLKYFKYQTLQPDEIICWLSYDEYDGIMPKSIQYCLDEGLLTEVRFVNGNTFGHKRYETFKENQSAYNILIDDDIYYPIDYVESLYKACKNDPNNVVCYYTRNEIYKENGYRTYTEMTDAPSFKNRYFSGLAAFPPNLFPVESFDYKYYRDKYCKKCDDSWVNGWLIRKNIKINGLHDWGKRSPLSVIDNTQEVGIYETHNGLKINGVMQASINIANAFRLHGLEKLGEELWPEFNLVEVSTCDEQIVL